MLLKNGTVLLQKAASRLRHHQPLESYSISRWWDGCHTLSAQWRGREGCVEWRVEVPLVVVFDADKKEISGVFSTQWVTVIGWVWWHLSMISAFQRAHKFLSILCYCKFWVSQLGLSVVVVVSLQNSRFHYDVFKHFLLISFPPHSFVPCTPQPP